MSVERPCDVCGELYEARRPNSRFCGAACRQRSARSGRGEPETVETASDEPVGAGVLAAAQTGDQLKALIALRDTLARQIDSSRDPFGLPALATRLQAVLAEIAKLSPSEVKKGTPYDEIAARRAARSADATGERRPARQRRR